MTSAQTFAVSSIGKKVLMALTGIILLGYVFIHMVGNLKIYLGPAEINAYAHDLRYLGEPVLGYYQGIWLARIVLLGAVVLHIWAAASLWKQGLDGRGDMAYNEVKRSQPAYTYAAYTMRWGGILIALFIIFHILHLTTGSVTPNTFLHPQNGEYFVYTNIVTGFQMPLISLFYLAAMAALCLHIYHGTWSMFQTLGINNSSNTSVFRGIAAVFAGVIFIGNSSIPLAVLAGIL